MLKYVVVAALLAACSKGSSSSSAAGSGSSVQAPGSGDDRAEARHKRLEAMRDKLDTNHDGKVSPDELAAAPGRMHFDDPAALDTNHDGDISLDELEAAMKARREQMRGKWGSGQMRGAGSAE